MTDIANSISREVVFIDYECDDKVRMEVRVGKKAAGRLLDGVLHDAYPEPKP